MRRVLVAGGAGYIGSHIVYDLLAAGYAPVVLDNLSTGNRAQVPETVPFVEADIADRAAVRATMKAHAITDVVHCAASLLVQESMRDPLKYWWNNVAGSLALVDSCVAEGVKRIVFSSTAAVYGDCAVMPVVEDLPAAPISPYGTTKRAVEVMLADVCRASGLVSVALRYFNVAGADPQGRAGASPKAEPALVRIVCQAALGLRDGVDVFGTDYDSVDGSPVRDYIHVCDLASVHTLMLDGLTREQPGTALVINCGYGHGITVQQVIDTTVKVSGRSFPVRSAPRRAGDIGIMVADTGLLRSRYGWTPKYADLEQIVADTLAWERRLMAGQ